MNVKNIFSSSVSAIFMLLLLFANPLNAKDGAKKLSFAASTFALYDIAKNIAGGSADVFMILPFGVDAHSYELTPKEMVKVNGSDLVLYNGAGLEPWVDGFSFKNRALDISKHVKLKELEDEHEHHHGHGHHKDEHRVDPHYWQDLENMKLAAELITKELSALLPNYSQEYVKNRDAYIKMLQNLDAEHKKRLSSCKLDTIIVNHNAFSYLAQRYGFHVEALSTLSPEAEPSAKTMIELIKHVKEHKVGTLFFESFASDRAIKSIAKEAKVKVDMLQPLGNITADEAKANLSYEDIMRVNLQKIAQALECK